MMAAVYIAFMNSLSNIYYSIFLALTMYIFLVVCEIFTEHKMVNYKTNIHVYLDT